MKIALITPYAGRSRNGNRNTAYRWADFLRQVGHLVTIQVEWDGAPADLMLALHARRSHESMLRFARTHPDRPLILALTGTDLYRDIRHDASAQLSMALATRMIVLQEMGLRELNPELRNKTSVIYQSSAPVKPRRKPGKHFQACVIGNLREEKDPFRCAYALRHIPRESRLRVIQIGDALTPQMAEEARSIMENQPRYRWLGALPHWQALGKLAQSHVMVISSRMEGGANVICEAVTAGVPVIASDIDGNIGMLGTDYAAYYPREDEKALADMLWRVESDPDFHRLIQQQNEARSDLFTPERERAGLVRLISPFQAGRG